MGAQPVIKSAEVAAVCSAGVPGGCYHPEKYEAEKVQDGGRDQHQVVSLAGLPLRAEYLVQGLHGDRREMYGHRLEADVGRISSMSYLLNGVVGCPPRAAGLGGVAE